MAKKNRPTGFKNCVCSKCGAEGHAPQGTVHRRCPGNQGSPIRDRHDYISASGRGKWE